MNKHDPAFGTLAGLLDRLQEADLPPLRKRDMVSAVRRICSMSGRSAVAIKLDIPELRTVLAGIEPAAHGIASKSFSNLRSDFAAAIVWAGIAKPLPRNSARLHALWGPLVAAVAHDKGLSTGLATFMNWCASEGIRPEEVEDGVLLTFSRWLETRTLHRKPRQVAWSVPPTWNSARRTISGWPDRELARISFRSPSKNFRWEELPDALREDAEGYLALRRAPDIFSEDPDHPRRPLATSTLHQHREHIRLAVSVLVQNGVPLEDLAGIADLVAPGAFKAVLRHYHSKASGEPSPFAAAVATTLIDIARYWAKVPPSELDALRAAKRKLPAVPLELTAKNKALIAQFESDEMKARLLFLPENLVRKVDAGLRDGRLLFVQAQMAVAISIQLVAPLRPQNLATLNLSHHFRKGPKDSLVLHIPRGETKSGKRDLIFELPPDVARIVHWYRREILPRLGADASGDLFVSKGGSRKSQETLSQQLTETLRKELGVHMTPHQFRHLAAYLLLEAHPEALQMVSDLLGHAWAKTTLVYAGSSSRRASRAYGKHLEEQRAALRLKGCKRRPGKRA